MWNLFKNRDTGIIEKLYDEYNKEIYIICYSYCRCRYDAEDCLQEVFCRALQKKDEIQRHPEPAKWLFTAARLVSLEKVRKNKKIMLKEFDIEDFQSAVFVESFEEICFENKYSDEDIVFIRNTILENLNEIEHNLYILRYIDKLDAASISLRLKISYSNTTTRLNRLKTKIKNLVVKYFL